MSDLPPITASAIINLEPMTLRASATVHSPIPDDHPYFSLIGRVTARWAMLETVLDYCIWKADGRDNATASTETATLIGASPRFALLKKKLQAKEQLPRYEAAITALASSVDACRRGRNRVTHDAWYIGENGIAQQLRQQNAKVALSFGFTDVPEAQFHTLFSEIDAAIDLGWKLFRALHHETTGPHKPVSA
ncbi:MAG: hypothetical protein WA840_02485 [Caulobacteraceae bacterium]